MDVNHEHLIEEPPYPDYPGTLCEWDKPRYQQPWPRFVCLHCGGDSNKHGAPEDIADKLKIDRNKRHLICHPDADKIREYNEARLRAHTDAFVRHWVNQLRMFTPATRTTIIGRMLREVDYKPEAK